MAEKKEKKEKTVWGSLLLIPIQFLLSTAIIILSIRMDMKAYAGVEIVEGHAAPVFSIFGSIIAIALFAIVTIISIIISIVRASKNKKAKQAAEAQNEVAAPAEEKPAE